MATLWTPKNIRHVGRILLDIPSPLHPSLQLDPVPPSNPYQADPEPKLNKPIMEVTGSLMGGVGCKAGVCSKNLVKKIEIFTAQF